MEGYSIYLMVSLAKSNGVMPEYLEYDSAWAKGGLLLMDFESSKFNVDSKSEYDCINEFLEDLNPTPKTIEVCYNCGSNHVERLHWVGANTNEVGSTTGEDEDTWCNKCEGHHGIIEKEWDS
jgi:hypothetical protein